MTSLPSDAVFEKGFDVAAFTGDKKMGVQIPGSKTQGYSHVYKNGIYPGQFTTSRQQRDLVRLEILTDICADVLLGTDEHKTRTAYDCFARGLSRSADKNCLGHRPYDPTTKTWGKYVWQTYEQVAKRRDAIGSGIVKLHENVSISDNLPLD